MGKMKKNKAYILIIVLVFALILGSGATCTMCGMKLDLAKDDSGISHSSQEQSGNQDGTLIGSSQENSNNQSSSFTSTTVSAEEAEKIKTEQEQKGKEAEAQSSESTSTTTPLTPEQNRFVISFDTMHMKNDPGYSEGYDPDEAEATQFFIDLGIPEQNIISYWGQDKDGATFENFRNAIDYVSSQSNNDSIIYVFILSHGYGNPNPGMEFADGNGSAHGGPIVTYTEISKMLDQIRCQKMSVICHSCALADSIYPLTENPAFQRLAMAPVTEQEILHYVMDDWQKVDWNKDGRVSVQDVYDFLKSPDGSVNPARYTVLEMVDNYKLAGGIFLK